MSELSPPERLDRPAAQAGGLSHLALLTVRGGDARAFLDAQLTRNVPPADGDASPAGYCSPKGRLLATFVVWSDAEAVWLLVARDIADVIAKRLRMYVLRSRAVVEDVTAAHALDGVVGGRDAPPEAPWSVRRVDGATWVCFPDGDARPRHLRIARIDAEAAEARAGCVDAATWRWLDLRAGLATIVSATQERFVPQMLNLEAVGGVDFRKGCYPGQEVVARSQYLGKLKRRMAVASLDASAAVPAPGADVFATGHAEAAGVIVDGERGPDGRVAMLAELPVALFASDALRAGAPDGPALTIEPLPYALPDNEVFVRPKL